MPRDVWCADCSAQYDIDDNTFCPRCGGTRTQDGPGPGAGPAVLTSPGPDRHGTRRRRVQIGGALLTGIGVFTLAIFVFGIIYAPTLVDEAMVAFAEQPGGSLHVQVLADGVPVEGASVTVTTLQGMPVAQNMTGPNGWVNVTDTEAAGVNVTVSHDGRDLVRQVLVLGPAGGELATELVLDTITDPETVEGWVGIGAIVTATRVMAGLFTVIAAVTVAGGIAAIRLRKRSLATAGAITGGIPWLIAGLYTLNAMALVVFAVFVVAGLLVRQGRDMFTD